MIPRAGASAEYDEANEAVSAVEQKVLTPLNQFNNYENLAYCWLTAQPLLGGTAKEPEASLLEMYLAASWVFFSTKQTQTTKNINSKFRPLKAMLSSSRRTSRKESTQRYNRLSFNVSNSVICCSK